MLINMYVFVLLHVFCISSVLFMNTATSVSVKKIILINHGGHNISETTSTSFPVVRQSAESETDAGNFSVSYVSVFSDADADRNVREKNSYYYKRMREMLLAFFVKCFSKTWKFCFFLAHHDSIRQ
ncbi:unnamed protein product [Brassica napus]|uniref:(rape) hypothetical protein n=1 Tax=Brassica napus TaxID=3708 RepID=A0A817B2J8_BRANA|nr:unnamed protein product [Brassica napus]